MAKKEDILQKLRGILPDGAITVDESYRTGCAFSALVPVAQLREALSACNEQGLYLESLTALDFEDTAELVYHLNYYEPKSRIVLRALCGHDQVVATVSDIFAAADWYEREVREFFGIQFDGHPDPRTLLLPEDADYHPLKKTFGNVHAYRKREEIYG